MNQYWWNLDTDIWPGPDQPGTMDWSELIKTWTEAFSKFGGSFTSAARGSSHYMVYLDELGKVRLPDQELLTKGYGFRITPIPDTAEQKLRNRYYSVIDMKRTRNTGPKSSRTFDSRGRRL